jgi:cytidyltransferase-like protein
VNFRDKIITWDQLPEWRQKIRAAGTKLVVTNGVFDILHLGHVTYLETARRFGEALLVGVNGNAAVRELKGKGRPVNSENDRACVLASPRRRCSKKYPYCESSRHRPGGHRRRADRHAVYPRIARDLSGGGD